MIELIGTVLCTGDVQHSDLMREPFHGWVFVRNRLYSFVVNTSSTVNELNRGQQALVVFDAQITRNQLIKTFHLSLLWLKWKPFDTLSLGQDR